MTGGEDGDRGRDGSGDRWCGTRVRLIALTWAFHIFTKCNYSAFYYGRLWVCFSMENITLKFVGGIRIHAVYYLFEHKRAEKRRKNKIKNSSLDAGSPKRVDPKEYPN